MSGCWVLGVGCKSLEYNLPLYRQGTTVQVLSKVRKVVHKQPIARSLPRMKLSLLSDFWT